MSLSFKTFHSPLSLFFAAPTAQHKEFFLFIFPVCGVSNGFLAKPVVPLHNKRVQTGDPN